MLRGESICGDRKICDYLVFVSDGSIVIGVVELKGKTVHASEVRKNSLTEQRLRYGCSTNV